MGIVRYSGPIDSEAGFKQDGSELALEHLNGMNATTAEVNRACDVSSRAVTITATGNVTLAANEKKVNLLGEVGGNAAVTLTLQEATGSGAVYDFFVTVVNTSNYVIKTADATNASFYGSVNIVDLDAAAQAAYAPAATDDIITLNGTTTGGQLGDWLRIVDIATDKWAVMGQLQCPTGSNPATPVFRNLINILLAVAVATAIRRTPWHHRKKRTR
jgi:hypothetical protein